MYEKSTHVFFIKCHSGKLFISNIFSNLILYLSNSTIFQELQTLKLPLHIAITNSDKDLIPILWATYPAAVNMIDSTGKIPIAPLLELLEQSKESENKDEEDGIINMSDKEKNLLIKIS